ncbi:Vascular endothelial zinc finger 1, partial [Habropoda laboriosa]
IHHKTTMDQQMLIFNKTSRTVPNILKSSLKLPRTFVDVRNLDENVHITGALSKHSLSQNIFVKKENKHKRISHKRKQELTFLNIWHDLPNWNVPSFADDKKEMLGENIFHTSTKLEASTQRKKLKQCTKNQSKKQGISVLRNEQKENPLLPVTYNVSTDFSSECQALSSLQDIESKHFQDSIDFSSNEIFNKFNYEFYDNISLDSLRWHITDSDETCTSLSTTCDNDIYEKAYDINANEIDIFDTTVYQPFMQNKLNKENISINQSLMFSEYQDEDTLSNDKNLKCSSGSCCAYCFGNCASNWITNSGVHTLTKDKLLAEMPNEKSQIKINDLNLNVTKPKPSIYVIDDTFKKLNSENTYASTIDTENLLQYADNIDSPLAQFTSCQNEKGTETEMYIDTTCTQEKQKFNAISNSSEEIDFNDILDMFQCLSCPLTFSNARTMAMHRAGAHGGMYVILCEACGRLFNRKYHFNRHVIDCRHSKEVFKCDICMRKYRHKSSLVHHLKIAHHDHYTRNDSPKFTCNVCNKVYSRFGCFENHMKSHKNAW